MTTDMLNSPTRSITSTPLPSITKPAATPPSVGALGLRVDALSEQWRAFRTRKRIPPPPKARRPVQDSHRVTLPMPP